MPGDDEITFDSLSQIHQKERNQRSLLRLRPRFYEELGKFVGRLNDSYLAAHTAGPTAHRAIMLSDELRKTRLLVTELYSSRLRKVLLLAHQAHEGISTDLRSLTPPELQVYESVLATLGGARTMMLGDGGGNPAPASPQPPASIPAVAPVQRTLTPVPPTRIPGPAPAGPSAPAPAAPPAGIPEAGGTGLVVVEAIEDTGDFVVSGGEVVNLRSQDVAALPEQVASLLVSRGLARRVESSPL